MLQTNYSIFCVCSGITKCVLVGDIVDMLSEYLCADWVVKPVIGLRFVEVRNNDGKLSCQFV